MSDAGVTDRKYPMSEVGVYWYIVHSYDGENEVGPDSRIVYCLELVNPGYTFKESRCEIF